MGFEPVAKALVLSLLLTSFMVNVFAAEEDILDEHRHGRYGPTASPIMALGHRHRHHKQHPPVKPPSISPFKPPSHGHPPVKPKCHPPLKLPSYPPVTPPSYPPVVQPPTNAPSPLPTMQLLAVQGDVFCMSCDSRGSASPLLGAELLPGAEVRLECNNTRIPQRFEAKTDENGFFLIEPKTVTSFESGLCRVTLLSSHSDKCSVPTDLSGGVSGGILIPDKPDDSKPPPPVVIYHVGPFAYEPAKSVNCP